MDNSKIEVEKVGGKNVEEYFKSYENFEVHRLMLADKPRTEAYQSAILSTSYNFKNKVVMDVGAGTGILSLFCAQAGAKKVYAVEASDLARLAKNIVMENKMENVIEVLHCRVEDVSEIIKVDIIVSEWMGFFLLHESMIDSVIFARDKHLKPGGLIYPEYATLKCSPCSSPLLFDFWDNVHGFQMKSMKAAVRQSLATKPEVMTLKPENLLSNEGRTIVSLDMRTASIYDVMNICSRVFISVDKNGLYQGVCLWFDVGFPHRIKEKEETEDQGLSIVLDTSPNAPPTHWQQTVVVWPEDQQVEEGDIIAFELQLERPEDSSRRYNIHMKELDPSQDEHPTPCECGVARCRIIKEFIKRSNDQEDSEELSDTEVEDSFGLS